MGICLDTEQNQGSQVMEGRNEAWRQENQQDFRYTSTPPDGHFPMHNGGNVNFETPKVPVIFVLGGPGSGKVTHCDNLMQEKKGIIHINMTDLLQQYAIGNDLQDFSQLSSRTVTEVLMLEMKMAPNAKTYLVSGYPRSMRDVVEYSEKIQVVNGVILISWRQKVLERQIDYGAKLGQVVLSLARMELNNFFKNVMPVADYFDQSNMLISVNGERHPGEVYKDFRTAVMRILGQQDNPPVFANGKAVSVPQEVMTEIANREPPTRPAEVITVTSNHYTSPVKPSYPPALWVIGGPGSNKAQLVSKALTRHPSWTHLSVGGALRAAAESGSTTVKQNVTEGELVPLDSVLQMVESHMAANMGCEGVVIDGFPRNMQQATEFENKFKQQPTLILLDCSKLQLGRGRLDDSVSAFRRRLEIFREHTLPMLKAMDNVGRLTIVDGDTDTSPVQEDFNTVMKQHIQFVQETKLSNKVDKIMSNGNRMNGTLQNGRVQNPRLGNRDDTTIHDLEELDTISKHVQNGRANGYANGVSNGVSNGFSNGFSNGIPNGISNGISNGVSNGVSNGIANGKVNGMANLTNGIMNGKIPNGKAIGNGFLNGKISDLEAQRRENIRNIYQGYPVDNHI